ncbi:cellulase family glycosylhydrolase [Dysgonomonas macrotermitis]|uniref:Endoglucanase n=1 Tax=Dysgonomonas macrotermitis TaxID=1346286 RepID=A0A1M4VQH5_9BACT|nr:cellulase family glycosylhydrolase [Dysgonomonas macrotermitis]SHE71083.1 endoglucanase [Dysgonomonas macrotermitis]
MKRNKNIMYLLLVFWVVITGACSSDDDIKVTPEFSITLNGNDVNELIFNSGSSFQMVAIKSNVEWNVSGNQDWCTLSNSSGEPTLTDYQTVYLKVEVQSNIGDIDREALITLTAGGETKTVKVTQYSSNVVEPEEWENAPTVVKNMKVGWNLFNTLDSYGSWITGTSPSDYETAWGQIITKPELMKAVKDRGFNAMRIPVTWFPHLDENGKVNEAWMNRVEEVVNYVLENDMYCILNVHHDTGGDESAWLIADLDNYDEMNEKFISLWTQIGERFAGYDHKLVFEGYNEMLDKNFSWTNPSDPNAFAAINKFAQQFVTTIRTTGGNNRYRNLIVNTYGGDPGENAVSNFTVPFDEVADHLIVEVHVYEGTDFESEGTSWTAQREQALSNIMDRLNTYFVTKGVPVIIGECGTPIVSEKEEEIAKYADYLIRSSKQYNMACFWWFDLIDRSEYQWRSEIVTDALINAIQE